MLNKIKWFLKKDIVKKILILIVLGLVLYYFLTTWFKNDELIAMMWWKWMSYGYKIYIDFFEFHSELPRQFIAEALKLWIPSELFVIWFKTISFCLYVFLIYKIIWMWQKKEKLIFWISKNTNSIFILFISSIVWFTLTYTAIMWDTFSIILNLVSLYFLLKWWTKNIILAGILWWISILCVQKSIFVLPLIYILSLDKNCIRNYKKTFGNMFLYLISLVLFVVVFALIRYRNYSIYELWIIKESLWDVVKLTQSPSKTIKFLIDWWGMNGIISLIYLMPWLLILVLSKRKALIALILFMTIQLTLMRYLMNALPMTIIRYFFFFLCLTPIYFTYNWLDRKSNIKMCVLFVSFLITYLTILTAANYQKMSQITCPTVYKLMYDNIKNNKKMFYDVACPYFDNEFYIDKFKIDNSLLNNKFDVQRYIFNIKYEDTQKLPHLKDKFSLASDQIRANTPHVYSYASWCTYVLKIWSLAEEQKDQGFPFSFKCMPLVNRITKYYNEFQKIK